MSPHPMPLREVFDTLARETLLPESAAAEARRLLDSMRQAQPWYVRVMVGFGAWLASLLLIGFVAGFGIAVGGFSLIGLALIGGAVWARRQHDNDFVVQAALATSLAGQAMFAWGIGNQLPGDEAVGFCFVTLAMSAVLFALYPDRVHRVLGVLFAAISVVMLLYSWELNALVPLVGPALAAAVIVLHERRARLTALGHGWLVRPLQSALMLAAFGALLLSTIYVLPDAEPDIYPRPWISTLLLGALLLYVVGRLRPVLPGATSWHLLLVQGLVVLVIAAAWAAPGVLLALTFAALGAASGNRAFLAAGVGFLAVFVGAYFYGIEVTMLAKSITLIATGGVLLLMRQVLLALLPRPAEAPSDD